MLTLSSLTSALQTSWARVLDSSQVLARLFSWHRKSGMPWAQEATRALSMCGPR